MQAAFVISCPTHNHLDIKFELSCPRIRLPRSADHEISSEDLGQYFNDLQYFLTLSLVEIR